MPFLVERKTTLSQRRYDRRHGWTHDLVGYKLDRLRAARCQTPSSYTNIGWDTIHYGVICTHGIRNCRACMWEVACGVPDISSQGVPLGFHSTRLALSRQRFARATVSLGRDVFVASFNLSRSQFPTSPEIDTGPTGSQCANPIATGGQSPRRDRFFKEAEWRSSG
jgi:hypothetical protein